jgi:hypothetical protein
LAVKRRCRSACQRSLFEVWIDLHAQQSLGTPTSADVFLSTAKAKPVERSAPEMTTNPTATGRLVCFRFYPLRLRLTQTPAQASSINTNGSQKTRHRSIKPFGLSGHNYPRFCNRMAPDSHKENSAVVEVREACHGDRRESAPAS